MSDATGLKARIRADLTAAMKAKDALTKDTLRMVLAAIQTAEVAGATAKELTDDEVVAVLAKEVKKRHESVKIYRGAGRDELADRESAEADVISGYLPQQLTDIELADLVKAEVDALAASTGEAPTMKQMGAVIKTVKAAAGSRAEGSRVAAAVKAALA